jgi:hypothetical protein
MEGPRFELNLLVGDTERLLERDLLFGDDALFRPRRISRRLLCVRGTNILRIKLASRQFNGI